MRWMKLVSLFFLPFLLFACAEVAVKRVTPNDINTPGVRYYRPYPYLLVNNQSEYKVIYLPKMDEEYSISTSPGFGSAGATCNLADGWNLTEYSDKLDSKVPETIDAVAGLLKEAAAAAKGGVGVKGLPPGLYRFDFDKQSGFVTGIKEVLKFESSKVR